jgi:hypothetical protein
MPIKVRTNERRKQNKYMHTQTKKINVYCFLSYNMFRSFRPSSCKSFYYHTQLFPLFPPYIGQCLHLAGRKVICVFYSINASYSLYANLKYMVKINFNQSCTITRPRHHTKTYQDLLREKTNTDKITHTYKYQHTITQEYTSFYYDSTAIITTKTLKINKYVNITNYTLT